MGSEPGFVVALFATLIADEGFVPLDPQYPEERIEFMLQDCGATTIITNQNNRSLAIASLKNIENKGVILVLEDSHPDSHPDSCEVLQVDGDALSSPPVPIEDLVYIVYTSGTTGRPKGVPITNSNLMPLMCWQRESFELGTKTRTAQTLSVSFDFGLQEIFTTLLYGGTLCYPHPSALKDLVEYVEFLREYRVNMVYATPSFMEAVLCIHPRLETLRVVLLGGEKLTWDLVDRLGNTVHNDCVVFNGYGPTEAAINCAMFKIERNDTLTKRDGASVPIGRPTGHSRLYVLDDHQRPVPIGVPGELYIGGPGVASGYLGRSSLTKQKFVEDIFSRQNSSRLYRTGDLVVNRPDGNLEFLGRLDHQDKIRGYRIEPEEIEGILAQHPQITMAAVRVHQTDNSRNHIVAYVVAGEHSLRAEHIRLYVRQRLPNYMVPAKVWLLPTLPLTESGKVDRNALRPPSETSDFYDTAPVYLPRRRAPYADWFYRPVWKPMPLSIGATKRRETGARDFWLIFGNGSRLAGNLYDQLQQYNAKVWKVAPSTDHTLSANQNFVIDPTQLNELENLFADLANAGQIPSKIIFIWDSHQPGSATHVVDEGCARLLCLLQAIGKRYRTSGLDLGIVTSNTHPVTGKDKLIPRHALIAGMCRSIPYELPNLRWTSIDYDQHEFSPPELARSIVDDLIDVKSGLSIAYRDNLRYVLEFEKLSITEVAASKPLGNEGVYLLTGGIGAIALQLAEHLVQQGAVKLALLDTRTALAEKNPATERILAKLAERGAEVLLVDADVCDQPQLSSAFRKVRSRLGEIAGVIHAAGAVESQILQQLTPEKMERVLNPKVQGTENLASELAQDNPDFILLCSSIDALRGNFGQTDYCAANAYLDAFSHHMNQKDLPYRSVNWEVWREVGMAARVKASPAIAELRRSELELGITPLEGRQVFDTILGIQQPQVIVSTTELKPRIGRFYLSLHAGAAAELPPNVYQERDKSIEATILRVFATVLGDNAITVDDNFFEKGGDSLSAMRIVAQINDTLKIGLSMSSVFEYPTVDLFAELVKTAMEELDVRGPAAKVRPHPVRV